MPPCVVVVFRTPLGVNQNVPKQKMQLAQVTKDLRPPNPPINPRPKALISQTPGVPKVGDTGGRKPVSHPQQGGARLPFPIFPPNTQASHHSPTTSPRLFRKLA